MGGTRLPKCVVLAVSSTLAPPLISGSAGSVYAILWPIIEQDARTFLTHHEEARFMLAIGRIVLSQYCRVCCSDTLSP